MSPPELLPNFKQMSVREILVFQATEIYHLRRDIDAKNCKDHDARLKSLESNRDKLLGLGGVGIIASWLLIWEKLKAFGR